MSSSAVSSTSTMLSTMVTHRRLIGGVIGLVLLLRKLRVLTRTKHDATQLGPVDRTLFPHYIRSNASGLWLYTRSWTVQQPRAIVFICHGAGEHIGRYDHIAHQLNEVGFSVYGMDHQGHGQSQGDRVYVERFYDYTNDYIQFLHHTQHELEVTGVATSKPLPCFLLAHSMGGTIGISVMNATYNDANNGTSSSPSSSSSSSPSSSKKLWPWSGCILSSAALVAHPPPPAALSAVVRAFSAVLPKMKLAPLNGANLSHIQTVVDKYYSDPLVYGGSMRARWIAEMVNMFHVIRETAPTHITWPYLFIQGGADTICVQTGAEQFHASTGSTDKTLKIYDEGYHELFADLCRDTVIADVIGWINQRIPN